MPHGLGSRMYTNHTVWESLSKYIRIRNSFWAGDNSLPSGRHKSKTTLEGYFYSPDQLESPREDNGRGRGAYDKQLYRK